MGVILDFDVLSYPYHSIFAGLEHRNIVPASSKTDIMSVFEHFHHDPWTTNNFIASQFRSAVTAARGTGKAAHPHTNMAKASLNMLTCSIADDLSKFGVCWDGGMGR